MRSQTALAAVLALAAFTPTATYADDSAVQVNEGSTIVYGAAFIAGFPNAVTVADIIERIPGGSQILGGGGNNNARGFSNNDDRILIDGKRISGKSNDGGDALERITIEQVDRIELIRGGNPDVKVSSQEAIINIILREGSSRNAGSYETELRVTSGGATAIGGKLSYGGTINRLDYFITLERVANAGDGKQYDRDLDANGTLTRQLNEVEETSFRRHSIAGNLGYNFDNGDILRLNGKWEIRDFDGGQPGVFFFPDGNGNLVEGGRSFRSFISDRRPGQLEFSGDYEGQLSDLLKLKIIGLYSESEGRFAQAEDEEIIGDVIEEDFRFVSLDSSDETIGRASLTWTPGLSHSLEFGSELALNNLDSGLESFERENGVLVQQDVSGANIRIEETRNESFVTHSWTVNSRLNIETNITTEYSEIRQSGENIDLSRDFFFVKPSTDIRFNLTDRQQLQFSVRRRVSQLNFGDFAASVSGDDEVVGSNADLAPQKQWQFETSYEYRLPDDQGSFKLGFRYDDFQDLIQRIETSPGVSGVGNVGSARRYRFSLDGNLRLGFIGLEDALLETEVQIRDSKAPNPFTGGSARFNNFRHNFSELRYRHDLRSLGASYGVEWQRRGKEFFQDIDETIEFKGPINFLSFFAEAKIIKGLIGRFEVRNILNEDQGRIRRVFEDGVASGVQTSAVDREFRNGQRFFFTLKGTF